MKKRILFLLFITFLSVSQFSLTAQVTASFNVNDSTGCGNLAVLFTNTSDTSASPKANAQWYFGNGNQSIFWNASANYTDPGVYEVVLIVTQGVFSDTARKNITVYNNPTAKFSSDPTGCVPFEATFTNVSEEGDATINQWQYTTNNVDLPFQDSIYTYNSVGNYDVILQVWDENGCTDDTLYTDYIEVIETLNVDFTFFPEVSCIAPQAVFFTNETSGHPGKDISYTWKLGNGDTSNQEDTTYTYDFGNHNVELVADYNPSYGCPDSIFKTVRVVNVQAVGTLKFRDVDIEQNDTICPQVEVEFKSTSTGDDVLWTFRRIDPPVEYTSTLPQGTQLFTPGDYVVTLRSTTGICSDDTTWNFHVEEVIADFSQSVTDTCKSPVEVQFTDMSTNAAFWRWEFHEGDTSNARDTSFTYAVDPPQNEYEIRGNEQFNTTLRVISDNFCESDPVTKTVNIHVPTAAFSIDTSSGCYPLPVWFKDKSSTQTDIVSWEWLFGDGETAVTSIDSVEHIFDEDNTYQARVVITTDNQCSDTSYAVEIKTGQKFEPNFTISDPSACKNGQIQFIFDTSIPEYDSIDSWKYFVGTTPVASNIKEHSPIWKVRAPKDVHDVKLEVNDNGCISDTLKNAVFESLGPDASFFISNFDCESPLEYTFDGSLSTSGATLIWDFAGGSDNGNNITPTVTFPTPGDKYIELVVQDGVCFDTSNTILPVRDMNTTLVAPPNACVRTSVLFEVQSDDNNDCLDKYVWYFGNSEQPFRTKFDTIWRYVDKRENALIAKVVEEYSNGCFDSAETTLRIFEPFVKISSDTAEGCSPIEVTFYDSSEVDYNPHDIWWWNYGDGSLERQYSSYRDTVKHTFTNKGVFQTILTIQDTMGCRSFDTTYVYTANPVFTVNVIDNQFCLGDSVGFSHNFALADSVIWDFDDGTIISSTTNSIYHTYTTKDDFRPSATVYKFACPSTETLDSGIVQMEEANAVFYMSQDSFDCYEPIPKVRFKHNPEDNIITSGLWIFDNGDTNNNIIDTLTASYPTPGVYIPKLQITTSFGCTDTAQSQIIVTGPTATIVLPGDTSLVCRGTPITFTATNIQNVDSLLWFAGDGSPSSPDNPFTHTYSPLDKSRTLSLQLKNEVCVVNLKDTIYMDSVTAGFSYADTIFCEGAIVEFVDNSYGDIVSYEWNFGNGDFSSDQNPTYIYISETARDYKPSLTVTSAINCSNSVEDSVYMHLPPEVVSISPEQPIFETPVTITVEGGDIAYWSPNYALEDSASRTTLASPERPTTYIGYIKDTLTGCINSDSTYVFTTTLEMPTAFAPESDNPVNRIVYVRGTGIVSLKEFSIYNRWGNRVFFTDDIEEGWDGNYNGKPQNIDSYTYVVTAVMRDGREVTKKGSINLVR